MKRTCNVLVTILCTVCIISCVFGNVVTLAEDLLQDTEDLKEVIEEEYQGISDFDQEIKEDGFIEITDEDPDDFDQVLSDTFYDIKAVKPSGNVRTIITNTYDPTNTWLFDEEFFKTYLSGTSINNYLFYVFPDGYFGDQQDTLITDFFNHFPTGTYLKKYCNWTSDNVACTVVYEKSDNWTFTSTNTLGVQLKKQLVDNGFPSKNTYWEVPEVTPDPTPDPTPSVTPTPDPGQEEVYLENKPEFIVLIFSMGLVFGFLFGRVVLGFIK